MAIFLVIALIILCIVPVVASALVPSFWVLAGMVLLTILAMMTAREIRVRPGGAAVRPNREASIAPVRSRRRRHT